MATRYNGTDADVPDLELGDMSDPATYQFGKLTTLLAWSRQHPPINTERERNQRVYSDYQHNRNPFIDYPEYGDMIFLGLTTGVACKNLHFTAEKLTNSAISGDFADADGDGLCNRSDLVVVQSARVHAMPMNTRCTPIPSRRIQYCR